MAGNKFFAPQFKTPILEMFTQHNLLARNICKIPRKVIISYSTFLLEEYISTNFLNQFSIKSILKLHFLENVNFLNESIDIWQNLYIGFYPGLLDYIMDYRYSKQELHGNLNPNGAGLLDVAWVRGWHLLGHQDSRKTNLWPPAMGVWADE